MKRATVGLLMFFALAMPARAELRVPAFTAYVEPSSTATVSDKGISGWNDPKTTVLWAGRLPAPGKLDCAIALKLADKATSHLRLTVAGQSHDAEARGAGAAEVVVPFGTFEIAAVGYQRFILQSLNPAGTPTGEVTGLIIDGPAARDAYFNLLSHRNAAAVHLMFPVPKTAKVDAFYCEVTGVDDPEFTYFMACGWHRGYLGMQINGPTERRIIFSVWDSGNEAIDRGKVAADDRAMLVEKGEGVEAHDFGHEGTGGHSHLVYPWKDGQRQRFLVTGKPAGPNHAIFAGYWFHPDKKQWMLISSWKAPNETGLLHGLYSFNENFGGSNGQLCRKALYGNQWIHQADGGWQELTTASFGTTKTGKADRFDRFMGIEAGQFFLSTGGFTDDSTPFRQEFTRPPTEKPPTDLPEFVSAPPEK